jgi:uncharacterized protein (DUF58 family)
VSPSPRTALAVGAVALAGLLLPLWLAGLALVALAAAAVVDALAVRARPEVTRAAPKVLSRGVPAKLRLEPAGALGARLRLRQPLPPDLALDPAEADGRLDATLVARRRGRHVLPAAATRSTGPLGLGRWYHRAADQAEVLVYPDLPAAYRLAQAVRQSRFRDAGERSRGPLGLGTDFESVRDYLPDDDIRQVNWQATARLGRPMSNQYRIEQDREVICLVDAGRLMAAPLGDRTRLDAAVDAVAAVAAVADELGDRCGTIAFDAEVRRSVAPSRQGGRAVIRALFDLEPTRVESDYELAFRSVGGAKRAFVLVLTDLLDESAARGLVDAVPVLRRHHAVAVASAADTDLAELVAAEPVSRLDAYRAAVARDVLTSRLRVVAQLRGAGADVVEAPPDALAAACVRTYLRAKARARL